MRNLTLPLESYSINNEFELLEVSRRRQYENGEPIDEYYTIYKALINYQPTEVRIDDDGEITKDADKVLAYVQSGQPLKVSFMDCIITVFPKSQYELAIRGSATKAVIKAPKTTKPSQE